MWVTKLSIGFGVKQNKILVCFLWGLEFLVEGEARGIQKSRVFFQLPYKQKMYLFGSFLCDFDWNDSFLHFFCRTINFRLFSRFSLYRALYFPSFPHPFIDTNFLFVTFFAVFFISEQTSKKIATMFGSNKKKYAIETVIKNSTRV